MLKRLRDYFSGPAEAVTPTALEPRCFAMPEGMRAYVIGDIHGKADLLARTMTAIEADARQKPAVQVIEIFLGDYIDRGMKSREVIDLLLATPPKNHQRVCLMGNHEETLLRFLHNPNILRDWGNFGGYATLAAYGISIPGSMSPASLAAVRDAFQASLPATHLNFFQNLRLYYALGDYLFVHAGLAPNVSIDAQAREQLLWIREPFLSHRSYFEQYVVHGHSPVSAPDIRENRANLDVSDATIDSLCCLVLEGLDKRVILMTDEDN